MVTGEAERGMGEQVGAAKGQVALFFGAVILMSAAVGIHESTFNNFLSDTFGLSASARGWLELPRELPGFLVVVMAGVLAALPVTRLGAVGAFIAVVGLVGLAIFGQSYGPMIVVMMLVSAGTHLLMPVGTSIALGLSNSKNRGLRLGQLRALATVGMILGSGFVWVVFEKAAPQYRLGFLCAAGLAAVAAVVYGVMHISHLHQPRARLVMRKKFWLYYVLEFLFGARKQIFLTFGPWVLIRIYGQPASGIAGLFMTAALIGVIFKPLVGLLIDRIGERVMMVIDGLVLVFVCLGYGYALRLAEMETARVIACTCFVADNLLFSLGTARATYVSRLADSAQELTPTLSMGVSINHIASMLIPALAGGLWVKLGYESVFVAGAILALLISGMSWLVPARGVLAAQEAARERVNQSQATMNKE